MDERYRLQAQQQLEASNARLRRMDLANMRTPAESLFDADVASDADGHKALRDQDTLEMLHAAEPEKLMYAIHQMLRLTKYAFKREHTYLLWLGYARRVFNAAVEAGNPEACAIVTLFSLAEFAKQCEKRRTRIERAQARSPELRKAAAQKAVITRRRNSEMRVKFAETDKAIEDAFAAAEAMANAG